MACMDVQPDPGPANGRTVVLFHSKNFFGAYWEPTIEVLRKAGYRVVVPDQIGFGKSSKPDAPYSFHRMGLDTATLLDRLPAARQLVVNMTSASGGALERLKKPTRVVISATNGKTTTAAMVASILERTGARLVHNRAGANMAGGIASALANASASNRCERLMPTHIWPRLQCASTLSLMNPWSRDA